MLAPAVDANVGVMRAFVQRSGALAGCAIVTCVIALAGGAIRDGRGAVARAGTPPGTIVYTGLSGLDIFTIRSDGSQKRQIFQGGTAPAWSPDGQQIALTYENDEVVYVIPAAGAFEPFPKDYMVWIGDSGWCAQPTWGPHGSIACIAQWSDPPGEQTGSDDHTGLCFSRGPWPCLLVDEIRYAQPAWSPDGSRIALDGIKVIELKTRKVRTLAAGSSPDWSPDGKLIAYSTGRAIAVIQADGSHRRTIVSSRSFLDQPSWSPDGKQLVYAAFPKAEMSCATGHLYIVRADGREPRLLVTNGCQPDWRPR